MIWLQKFCSWLHRITWPIGLLSLMHEEWPSIPIAYIYLVPQKLLLLNQRNLIKSIWLCLLKYGDNYSWGSSCLMKNCFCRIADWRKAFSRISSRDHCERSSPSLIYDMPQADVSLHRTRTQALLNEVVKWW